MLTTANATDLTSLALQLQAEAQLRMLAQLPGAQHAAKLAREREGSEEPGQLGAVVVPIHRVPSRPRWREPVRRCGS